MHAMTIIRAFLARRTGDTGASLVEYALLVSLIAVVSLVAVTTLGVGVSEQLQGITSQLGD